MRPVLALAATMVVAACANSNPAPEAQACRVDPVVELPMLPGTPLAVVPARLDGLVASMLVDTGNERLTILAQAQRRLGLAEDTRHRTTVNGIGGSGTSNDAVIQRFELGEVELPQSGAAVVDQPMHPFVNPPMAGWIGGDTLSGFDVELSFNTRTVVLWQRTGCTTVVPARTGAWSAARLIRGSRNLISLTVSINGHSVRALLATGSRKTTVALEAATRLGITPEVLAASRSIVLRGEDGNDVMAHLTRVEDIAMGSVHARGLLVAVGPIHARFADVLLGADFLQNHDLWLSYDGQMAFIK